MSGRVTIAAVAAAAFVIAFIATLATTSHDPQPVRATPSAAATEAPVREPAGAPARLRAVADLPALRRSPTPAPTRATLVVAPAPTPTAAPLPSATTQPAPVPTVAAPAPAPAPAPRPDHQQPSGPQDTFDSSG